ncbi:MAG TPA: TIGR03617 family F420-dependent LLM class oxidoreductase [Anaerolineales bacterium]|nr:TIGR03617 family F420-dependent LLM class oxidoreductase [Anaerolineales bacterium]
MMLLDVALMAVPLTQMPSLAQAAEQVGFAAAWTSETQHDPFLPLALAAEHTRRLQLGTAVAIAFARSPLSLAQLAWDLAAQSDGRFILGLGTQVRAHIERRFGMPWPDSPVAQLREQVLAIRAIWHAWQTGQRLNFRGERYKLTLMTPFFNPGPIAQPQIPIYLSGVNTGLAQLAGEVADGFHAHPFHTPAYLRDVIRPALVEGRAGSGPAPVLSATVFAITAEAERATVREQIAFYASTPSYRAVLAHHGWAEIGEQLSALAARGRWAEMPALIDDTLLAAFAVEAPLVALGPLLRARYAGLADRLTLYKPYQPGVDDVGWNRIIADC